MTDNSLLYLSRQNVESIKLSMQEIIDAVEDAFIEKGNNRTEMPPKPGIHTLPDAFIHAMPAFIPSMKAAGMKWVSGYPENVVNGLPYISGLLILNDHLTGFPKSVMDCTWITAQRTGAATAVAAKYLARKESSTVGIIACGIQGRSNLEALNCLFSISEVKAFDTNAQTARKYSAEMSKNLDLVIKCADTSEEAAACDIVVTSGPILKHPDPAIKADWLTPGSFACPLDFDSYFSGEAFTQADKLSTDDHIQMAYYRSVGYFGETPKPYADLGEIVAGKSPGRENDEERIISVNLGLAIEDMAVAEILYQKAVKMQVGTRLEL